MKTYIFIGLLFCWILFSCSKRNVYPAYLSLVEQWIESCPDSARFYFNKVNAYELKGEARAYYNLLSVKLNDKQYLKHTSDSVIKQVVAFYENNGDVNKLLEAYYYMGRIYRDMGDSPQALKVFQQALTLEEESTCPLLLGRIYEQIGTLLAYQGFYQESLDAIKHSYRWYEQCDRKRGMAYAYRNMGRAFDQLQQMDSAEYYYQKAYQLAIEAKDNRATNYILSELASMYQEHEDWDKCQNAIAKLPREIQEQDAITLFTKGMICLHQAQRDSASYYYKQALQADQAAIDQGKLGNRTLQLAAYEALLKLEAISHPDEPFSTYALSALALNRIERDTLKKETVGKIHALYNYQAKESEKQQSELKNERTQKYFYLSIILFVVIIYLIVRYAHKKQIKVKRQAEMRIHLAEKEKEIDKEEIAKNKKRILELELALTQKEEPKQEKENIAQEKRLLKLRNIRIYVNSEEKELQDKAVTQSNIYQFLHTEALKTSPSVEEEHWNALIQLLENTYKFTSQLYAVYPRISPQELHICCLCKISISVSRSASLLHVSKSAISNARVKMAKRILGDGMKAEDFERFIMSL